MRRLETAYSTLRWSDDGLRVTKTRPPGAYPRYRFENELRVNRLLRSCRPPVCTAGLLAHDVHARSLTFEALHGTPFGPKYPQELTTGAIDEVLAIGGALSAYDPSRRWLRRFDSVRRIVMARDAGLLTGTDAVALIDVARDRHRKLRFGHGDLTARNVLRVGDGAALIDWEWAGCYPRGYDAAFLWFSLQDVPGGRAHVERSVAGTGVDAQGFLLCALLVELWHLRWYVPEEFRARHEATRDELLDRLLGTRRGAPDRGQS